LPRLKNLSGKEVCNILKRHGFKEVRRRSSHITEKGDMQIMTDAGNE
jgi:predicted RNA binding protein YcfA (HicA-like mRNA interferase family)